MPVTNPLARLAGADSHEKLPEIDLGLLKDESFILPARDAVSREIIDRAFSRNGIMPSVILESRVNSSIIKLVSSQVALSFFPRCYVVPNRNIVYFSVPSCEWTLNVAVNKGTYLSAVERDFINMCIESGL